MPGRRGGRPGTILACRACAGAGSLLGRGNAAAARGPGARRPETGEPARRASRPVLPWIRARAHPGPHSSGDRALPSGGRGGGSNPPGGTPSHIPCWCGERPVPSAGPASRASGPCHRVAARRSATAPRWGPCAPADPVPPTASRPSLPSASSVHGRRSAAAGSGRGPADARLDSTHARVGRGAEDGGEHTRRARDGSRVPAAWCWAQLGERA